MNEFVHKHEDRIHGVLSCFDRMLLRGYLPRIRDVWRKDFDVAVFTLQEGIIPKDHAMFEQYWIDQFADLLNIAGNRPDKQNSANAKQIIAALQDQLERARKGEGAA